MTHSIETHRIGLAPATLETIGRVAREHAPVVLSVDARARIDLARAVVDAIQRGGDAAPAVYGVNTGFGFLADVRISAAQVRELQRNLIRSHAAGVGAPLSDEVVRGMLLLRAEVLACGHSGVRADVAQLLVDMLNKNVHPIIPAKGSVGASGDLAPLAHLALVVMGEGEARVGRGSDARTMPGGEALRSVGLSPIVFEAKEGISLVNGTQCMTSIGALALLDAESSCRLADIIGAISLEALQGTPRAFDPRIHAARPHVGQRTSAQNLARLLEGSSIVASHAGCGKVQDPYSLRCMPQVHGASRDALRYARDVLEIEARSATDNPLVFADDGTDDLLSGGNFHGQPVALALDFAAIATAELANIAERRIEQLVNPHLSSGLPAFLAPNSGLHSGFMIAQVTAAALVSENKILAHPASVDSIPSSASREDHVSMGVHAADKFARIVDNVRNVQAIELLCAAQGVELRGATKPSRALQAVIETVRAQVTLMKEDRPLYIDIAKVRALIDSGAIEAAAMREVVVA